MEEQNADSIPSYSSECVKCRYARPGATTDHRDHVREGHDSIPCTTPGCESVKFFAGRCNPCQKEWEAANLVPLDNPYGGMSWVEECMAKQGSNDGSMPIEGPT